MGADRPAGGGLSGECLAAGRGHRHTLITEVFEFASLCPHTLSEPDAVAAFKDLVGLPRHEVAQGLIERFGLDGAARSRMAEYGVETPWQAFVQVRMRFYDAMLADPEILRNNQWPHNVASLQTARQTGCKVGLATMSRGQQAQRVLEILDLGEAIDFVATRDDVERGKPDPEIYQLVARELGVAASECLVIEDSPTGVKAALSAGMHVVAVSTPFTREGLYRAGLLPAGHIVDDPSNLAQVVEHVVSQHLAELILDHLEVRNGRVMSSGEHRVKPMRREQ